MADKEDKLFKKMISLADRYEGESKNYYNISKDSAERIVELIDVEDPELLKKRNEEVMDYKRRKQRAEILEKVAADIREAVRVTCS
jgi:hypothetical protein